MDADDSLNESTEVHVNIEAKEIDDCGCSEDLDRELNKKILRAFLKNNDSVELHLHEDLAHIPEFTTFSWEHMQNAHGVADNLVKDHEDDVDKMIDKLSALKNVYPNSAYADYLSRISLYKHPTTKNLVCPPIHEVSPHSFFPLKTLRESELSYNTQGVQNDEQQKIYKKDFPLATILGDPRSLDLESKLDWWREDIQLSEHHANWHAYYPFQDYLNPNQRRGELFAYMHQQMLARYDFERFAVGLPPVVPYGPGIYWDKPLPEGCNIKLLGLSARPANMSIPDRILFQGQPLVIKDIELHKERILHAIARKEFIDPDGKTEPVTMDKLGCTVEADGNSVNKDYYGDIHNIGHVVIAMMTDPDGRYGMDYGPMFQGYSSARDPVFYRWHKFIDSIFEAFRIQLKPRILEHINMFKPMGIELKVQKVSIMTDSNEEINDLPIAKDCLYTKMTNQSFNVYWEKDTMPAYIHEPEDNEKGQKPYVERIVKFPTLKHFPFDYHFTISLKKIDPSISNQPENTDYSDINTLKLMFRVFIAPKTQVKDLNQRRNHFVELDSFVHEIKWDPSKKGGTQTFDITRKSEDSSVAMQPIPRVKDIYEGSIGSQSFCGCGWPINLLIPRGTPTGMDADLFVLVTDWREDAYDGYAELTGGSAYCGKSGKPYPDKKPMGYPFDQNFKFLKNEKTNKDSNTLMDVVGAIPNSHTISVTIKFLGKEVSGGKVGK